MPARRPPFPHRLSTLLRLFPGLALGCALLLAPLAGAADWARVTLLSTTDLHGHIYPIDYDNDRPADEGLAKIATLVRRLRKEAPHLLLVDCGDTIQGTPLVYYHNRINNGPVDPMMLVMNSLGYDCMTLGNHEYNFGLGVLGKARGEARFPWLSANTYQSGTDKTAFPPYLIKVVDGVRVGILGLTTPAIPTWENPENYAGLEFREAVSEAAKWAPILRRRERVDLLVGAFHMGLERDLATGRWAEDGTPAENACIAIAQRVPDFDVIFMGHTHRSHPALVINGVLLAQAGRWGDHLVRADVELERPSGARWRVFAKGASSLAAGPEVPADPAVLAATKAYQDETEAWLARPIGTCARTLDAAEGSLKDTALVDLVQRVQLEAGRADVSLAANFNRHARIGAGPVTVREIAGLYVYENTLCVVEVTGAQLKAALEQAARYFRPYLPGSTAAELVDPAVPDYNFDMAAGVTYVIDLRRPYGDRIRDLAFRGAPLSPERRLRLAVNNYRVNGGGGYSMLRGAPVLYRSSAEIRNLIIEWVERHGSIPVEPAGNWRIVP